MSEGQMNTIALCVPMCSKVDKEPNKNGQQGGFGPWVAYWEPLTLTFQPDPETYMLIRPKEVCISDTVKIVVKLDLY